MADKSLIEWTDTTWQIVTGCSVVSPGCTNCYAMRMAARLERIGLEKYEGEGVECSPSNRHERAISRDGDIAR